MNARSNGFALALLLMVLSPAPALAGGLGVFDMTGFHAGVDPSSEEGANGSWLDQGGGVELLIGGKATRIAGRVRVLYNYVYNKTTSDHFGVALFGMEIQLLRNLQRPAGVHVHLDVGPGFIALQHEEFGMADLGLGVHRELGKHVTLFAEVSGQLRFRRKVWGGAVVTAGLRFPID